MAALTQREAVRRAELLAVDRHEVELDLTGLEHGSRLRALGGHNLVVQLSVPNWFFPVVGVDEAYRRRLVDVASGDDVSPPVRRAVLERADVLERMLRARAT